MTDQHHPGVLASGQTAPGPCTPEPSDVTPGEGLACPSRTDTWYGRGWSPSSSPEKRHLTSWLAGCVSDRFFAVDARKASDRRWIGRNEVDKILFLDNLLAPAGAAGSSTQAGRDATTAWLTEGFPRRGTRSLRAASASQALSSPPSGAGSRRRPGSCCRYIAGGAVSREAFSAHGWYPGQALQALNSPDPRHIDFGWVSSL